MSRYLDLQSELKNQPRRWLVTGAAGFIGSHLTETLLRLNQQVVGLDNLSTGSPSNLSSIREAVGDNVWKAFTFIEGDLVDPKTCAKACDGAHFVLHQAALGSVPRSIKEPLASHEANVTGMLNMLVAARDTQVERFVYASSSSVYGDSPKLPKVEDTIGQPLSPYAATKLLDEIYAATFERTYGMETIGLRYFNVFGPRQDPGGVYAAVIPKWIGAMLAGEDAVINGSGETSRDFCYVENAVQANLLAATVSSESAINTVFNVALHEQTSLNELFALIRELVVAREPALEIGDPVRAEFRKGDVMHSLADIKKAKSLLGYEPTHTLRKGLEETVTWFCERLAATR